MRPLPPFRSWLGPVFQRHVDLNQAGGYEFRSAALLIERFDRYLVARGARPPLTGSHVADYLATLIHRSPRTRNGYVSAIWRALEYARRQGARVDPLPARPRLPDLPQRRAFVLTVDQLKRLFSTIPRLAPQRPAFSRATDACLLGLLYTTGIRVGEALALDVGDYDLDSETLCVRHGKFGKSRLLPVRPGTAAALRDYLDHPLRPLARTPEAPFFVSSRRRRMEYSAARRSLRRVAKLAEVSDERGRLPRPHDLRHTFAVHRLVAWHRAERDVNVLLPLLSTYMGHVDPTHTYAYLQSAELLLQEAAQRFETWADSALEGGEE